MNHLFVKLKWWPGKVKWITVQMGFFQRRTLTFRYRRLRPKVPSSISQMLEFGFKPAVALPIRLLLRPLQLYPLTRKERSVIETWGIASGRLRRHKAIPDRWVQVLQLTIDQTRKMFFFLCRKIDVLGVIGFQNQSFYYVFYLVLICISGLTEYWNSFVAKTIFLGLPLTLPYWRY